MSPSPPPQKITRAIVNFGNIAKKTNRNRRGLYGLAIVLVGPNIGPKISSPKIEPKIVMSQGKGVKNDEPYTFLVGNKDAYCMDKI